MRPLTATDVLRIWELAERQGQADRALTILAAACSDLTREQLADLSIGQRDRRLFMLRKWLFGPKLDSFVDCSECGERLEFSFDMAAIQGDKVFNSDTAESKAEPDILSCDGLELCFRLPNSRDLIAATACAGPRQARQLLVERCLLNVSRQDKAIAVNELPEAVLEKVAFHLAQCDPLQEVLVDLACPACQHQWRVLFDIVTFFWAEIEAQAKRLLREVHVLARAYGWREADILSISARRRQSYLDMVGT